MASLREASLAYEEKGTTKNISELEMVKLDDCQLEERSFERSDGTPFSVEVISIDGVEYRVPKTVKKGIQACLSVKPDMKKFKVVRSGTTKDDTSYTVVPM